MTQQPTKYCECKECECDPSTCCPCGDVCDCKPCVCNDIEHPSPSLCSKKCPAKDEYNKIELSCGKPLYLKFKCPADCCMESNSYLLYLDVKREQWKKDCQQIRNLLSNLQDDIDSKLMDKFTQIQENLFLLIQSFNKENIEREMTN